MSDADRVNAETQLWLDFAVACNFISKEKNSESMGKSIEIGKLINYMMNNPGKFGL